MHRIAIVSLILIVAGATGAVAQPGLDLLWPNADGMRFAYQYHRTDLLEAVETGGAAYLVLEGTVSTAGGDAQNLLGEHGDSPAKHRGSSSSLLALIWRARPDLREPLSLRYGAVDKVVAWRPLLLHPGYFMKTAAAIQMWQDIWDHPTWTYLDGDPSLGASFTHQLVPELADDLFLHGTVTDIDATVTTVNGTYTGAVKVEYFIDLGVGQITDELGNPLVNFHSEVTGHVTYVPLVGPVEMLEEYKPFVWADCGTAECPAEVTQWLGLVTETQTLSLSENPVAQTAMSWGDIKSMYR